MTAGASLPGWGKLRPFGARGGSHRPSAVVMPSRGVGVGRGVAVAGGGLRVEVTEGTAGGVDKDTSSVGTTVGVCVVVGLGVAVGVGVCGEVGVRGGGAVGVKLG
jgi:hypothetical protein